MLTRNHSDYNYSPALLYQTEEDEIQYLGWNIPDVERSLMHTHWRHFRAPPVIAHNVLGVIYFGLFMISFIGNGVVLWIFSTSKSLRTPSNKLIINLALFDILMMLEIPLLLLNSYNQRIVGNQFACNIYAIMGALSGIGASTTNAMIALDRYKTVASPLDGRLTKGQVKALIIFTWVYAMPFSFMPAFKIWGRYVPEGFQTTCSFDYLTDDVETKYFVIAIFVWSFLIPLCCIIIFYTSLFSQVQRHERMLKEQARKMNVKSLVASTNESVQQKNIEVRIAKAALTIVFLFVCAWTPYSIITMIGIYGDKQLLTPFATMIPAVFAKIVSCLDPWVYAISHPRYRMELARRIKWLGIKESINHRTRQSTDHSSGVTTAVDDNSYNDNRSTLSNVNE